MRKLLFMNAKYLLMIAWNVMRIQSGPTEKAQPRFINRSGKVNPFVLKKCLSKGRNGKREARRFDFYGMIARAVTAAYLSFGKGKVTVQMRKHYCAIIGSVLFWGASYLATAVAYETISPLQLGLTRAVLAAALFFAYRALSGAREKVERGDWPRVVISGLFGVTLYFAFQNTALAMTSSSRAALITACYPVIVLTMECMVRRKLPVFRQLAGIAVAVAGVGMLTGSGTGEGSVAGDLMMVVPGVMWGCYCLSAEKLTEKYPTSLLTAWQMLIGVAAFVPLVLFEGRPWMMPTLRSGCAILFLAVCCSLLSFLFFNYSLKGLSVTVPMVLLNLQPVVGVVCSYLVLGETVTPFQAAGGAVIVAGVLLSTVGVKK